MRNTDKDMLVYTLGLNKYVYVVKCNFTIYHIKTNGFEPLFSLPIYSIIDTWDPVSI